MVPHVSTLCTEPKGTAHQLGKDGLRQISEQMVERHRDNDAPLRVRDEDDFGYGRIAKTGFEVIVGDADVHRIVREVPLDEAFEDVSDRAVADDRQ